MVAGNSAIDLAQMAPSRSPAAGRNLLYPKSDGKWYSKDSSGVETLVGALSQATETVSGQMEIATQAEITTGTDDARAVTPLKLQTRLAAGFQPLDADLTAIAAVASQTAYGRALLSTVDGAGLTALLSAASETVSGRIEIATQAEVTTSTDDARAITPLKLDTRLDSVVRKIEVGTSAFRRAYGLLHWEQAGTAIAGDLVIQTNQPFTNVMTVLHIHGYNFVNADNTIDLEVAYYAASTPAFSSNTVVNNGAMPVATVRLMRRTSDSMVAIVITTGNASNLWYYPKIVVDGVFGHTALADADMQGWSASITTDLSLYTTMTTATIAMAGNVTAALALKADTTAVAAGYQPLDADLTAIAAVASQTAYGRAFLALVNQAGLVALLPSYQPLDADLTAIAAVASQTAYGQALLAVANQAALTALNANATLTLPGIIELATQAEVDAGSDAVRAVAPSTFQTRLAAYAQPLDADLTTIAGLTATTDNFLVAAASAWASRTPAQARTSLGLVIGTNVQAWDADLDAIAAVASQTAYGRAFLALVNQAGLVALLPSYQPLDTDLTTIAGLTATTDNFIVSAASAWASRTPAQARTSLGLVIGTNVQAWDADLDAIAAVASQTAFGRALLAAVDAAGLRTTAGLGTIAVRNDVLVGYRSTTANQTAIAGSTSTTLTLAGTADHDIGSGFSKASDIVTITNAGTYRLHAAVAWASVSGSREILTIETWTGSDPGVGAGTIIARSDLPNTSGTTANVLNCETTRTFAAGAKVRVYGWHNGAINSNTLSGTAGLETQLNILRLA
jgi:hypothetical protein